MEPNERYYGLNGLGEIGRAALVANLRTPKAERLSIRVINEILETRKVCEAIRRALPKGTFLLEKDDGHGNSQNLIAIKFPDGSEDEIAIFNWQKPEEYRWREEGVTSVIDASRDPDSTAPGIAQSGVSEVLLTGPSDKFPEVIRGINTDRVNQDDAIYSNASCTTKAAAPWLKKVLALSAGGVLPGVSDVFLTGTHAATNTDSTVDRIGLPGVIDNIVAAKTGATKALQRIFRGQLNSVIIRGGVDRVPVTEGSRLNLHISFQDPLPVLGSSDKERKRGFLALLNREAPMMIDRYERPPVIGIDQSLTPDVRGSRDDERPSVLLESLLEVGQQAVLLPIRYNNVVASAREALLTIRLIREIRDRIGRS